MKNKLIRFFKNKYVLTSLIFVVWVSFFDRNNLISQWELKEKVKQLKEDKKYYKKQIIQDSISLYKLLNDPDEQERIGREKYLMKRDNEDIFLIIREDSSKQTDK